MEGVVLLARHVSTQTQMSLVVKIITAQFSVGIHFKCAWPKCHAVTENCGALLGPC